MRRRIGVFVLAFILAVALSWYVTPGATTPQPTTVRETGLPSNVTRWIDQEAGVVCYQLGQLSVSCVPLSSTRLGRK